MKRSTYLLFICLVLGIAAVSFASVSGPVEPAASSINATSMLEHVKRLASDEFEGRSPASKGEELTINYLAENFKKLGAKPGNPDGSYFQKVPLVSYKVDTGAEMTFAVPTTAFSPVASRWPSASAYGVRMRSGSGSRPGSIRASDPVARMTFLAVSSRPSTSTRPFFTAAGALIGTPPFPVL